MSVHRDGCGNLTLTDNPIPLTELLDIAKKHYPDTPLDQVEVGACQENGETVVVMTFHNRT